MNSFTKQRFSLRVQHTILVGCCTLTLFLFANHTAPAAETPREQVVFYLSRLAQNQGECTTTGCEWRTYDPLTGRDRLFLRLSEPPEAVFWDKEFQSLYYKLGQRLYKSEWRYGSIPESILVFPHKLNAPNEQPSDVWFDEKSGVWKMSTWSYTEEVGDLASLWQYSVSERTWETVRRVPTQCECGGCLCTLVVAEPSEMSNRVTLGQILEGMRIGEHLSRTGQTVSEDIDDRFFEIYPQSSGSSYLRVRVGLGDTAHAIAPLFLVFRSEGAQQEIFDANALGCSRQIAFEDFKGFLLVGSEYFGRCTRVIDLNTGNVIISLPKESKWAIWIPTPGPGLPIQ